MNRFSLLAGLFALTAASCSAAPPAAPKVGDEAKDFELPAYTGDGGKVKLSALTAKGPVVLVVLRGYPGYQCLLCTVQFGQVVGKADEFKAVGANVVFVYPGLADNLKAKVNEFVKQKDFPANVTVLMDPDYTFTNAYGLRWDAKGETAYPSSFVIDAKQKVKYAKVSTTHGGRSDVVELLKAVKE